MPPKRKRKVSAGGNLGLFQPGHCVNTNIPAENRLRSGAGYDRPSSPSPPTTASPEHSVTRSQTTDGSGPISVEEEYAIVNIGTLQAFINQSYRAHRLESPHCLGDLELKKDLQMVISTSWSSHCQSCDFISATHKMYRCKDKTGDVKSGRQLSTLNQALGIALCKSSIGATTIAEIFLTLGIIPGSHQGLTTLINDGSSICEEVCKQHLKEVRSQFEGQSIPVEADSRYNNQLGGPGPFQSGTQSVFTMCENRTDRKQIIDFVVENKLCSRCAIYRRQGVDVIPGGHPNCTATIKISDSIGREGRSAEKSARNLKKDGVSVSHVTTDGDGQAGRGIKKIFKKAQSLNDIIHMSRNQRKRIERARFSESMFHGKTKASRKLAQKWFSEDIRQRCSAEFTSAIHKCSDMKIKKDSALKEKLKEMLMDTPTAIINCYNGRCELHCRDHSHVCKGRNGEYQWQKNFMYRKKQVNMTKLDEAVLRDLILLRLGPKAINTTYLNSNTNKVESCHKGYSKTNPKNITCPRNFVGRISAAVLNLNLGFQTATLRLISGIGHEVSEDVKTRICQRSKKIEHAKALKKTKVSKEKRIETRVNLRKAYVEVKRSAGDDGDTDDIYRKNSTIDSK